jgi:hypothetical protein
MATTGINIGAHDQPGLPAALIGSLKTQAVTGKTRVTDDGEQPVFVLSDGDIEIELSHELGLREPAAAACERLAGALLAHAALIRAKAGSPRRATYVFSPLVER